MNRETTTADYIMEDPREAMRLELKVDPHAWVQKYLAHRIPVGADVLSVGCAPGVIIRELCTLDASIRATGLDIRYGRIHEAKQRNREIAQPKFVRGVRHALAFATKSSDLVYSRMLM